MLGELTLQRARDCRSNALGELTLQRARELRSNVLRESRCNGIAQKTLVTNSDGMPRAKARGMCARDFRDLLCWQLSEELKCEVLAFTATPPASKDYKFCDQIRDSSAGAPRTIAEGFARYRPAEFARFLEYARSSLMETRNHLIDARDRKFMSDRLYMRLFNLAGAALRVTTSLMLQKQREAARARAGRTQRPRRRP